MTAAVCGGRCGGDKGRVEGKAVLPVFFLLRDTPESEFLCADVSEHCSIFIGGVSRKNNWDEVTRLQLGLVRSYLIHS